VSLVPRGAQRASIQSIRSVGILLALVAALIAGVLFLGGSGVSGTTTQSTPNLPIGLASTLPASGSPPANSPGAVNSPGGVNSPGPRPAASPPPGSFVATNGSDSNPGTFALPWRSVQHAAKVASGVVWLMAGTYAGGITVTRSGITFEAYPGQLAIVNGGPFGFRFYKVSSGAVRSLTVQNASSSGGAGVIVDSSSNVTVADSVIHDNRNYGVRTLHATKTVIRDSRIYKNQEGIRISFASAGTQILNNSIYSQDTMFDHESSGGVGITFFKTTGSVLASGNRLWLNRARSHAYGYDGGAFEIFGASDVTITGNIAWDNKDVMETGTNGPACNNITFTRNIGFAASTVKGYARGLIIACASNSVIANNTLDGFDISDISVVNKPNYRFEGSLAGLKVENNILRSGSKGVFYFDHLPSSVVIDYNLIWNTSGGSLVYVVGKGSTSSFATLRSWIGGRMAHGIQADPRFYNGAIHDYRLARASAAIDRGVYIGAITPNATTGPDIGRFEMR